MGCTCVQSYEAPGDVQYSPNQLAYIWQAAGGNMQVVGVAVAIAMRESGGHSTATCVNGGPGCPPGLIDRGLWQIDSVHGSMSSYDVMTNARAAVSLYNAQGWEPWGGAIPPMNVTPDPSTPINATGAATNNNPGPTTTNDQQVQLDSWQGTLWHDYTHPWEIPGQLFGAGEKAAADVIIKGVIGLIINPMLNIMAGMFGIGAGAVMFLFGLFLLITDSGGGEGMGKAGELAGAGTALVGMITGQPEVMAAGGAMAGAGSGIGAAARSKASDVRSQRVGARSEERQKRQGERTAERQAASQGRMAERETYRQTQLNQRLQTTTGARSDLSGQRHAESMQREQFRTDQFSVRQDLRDRSREFARQQAAADRAARNPAPPSGPAPKKPSGQGRLFRERDARGRFT